jgi:hypothetical protein
MTPICVSKTRIARIYAHALAQPNILSWLEKNALFFKRFEKSTVIVRIFHKIAEACVGLDAQLVISFGGAFSPESAR